MTISGNNSIHHPQLGIYTNEQVANGIRSSLVIDGSVPPQNHPLLNAVANLAKQFVTQAGQQLKVELIRQGQPFWIITAGNCNDMPLLPNNSLEDLTATVSAIKQEITDINNPDIVPADSTIKISQMLNQMAFDPQRNRFLALATHTFKYLNAYEESNPIYERQIAIPIQNPNTFVPFINPDALPPRN